jgi:hypothetical protein
MPAWHLIGTGQPQGTASNGGSIHRKNRINRQLLQSGPSSQFGPDWSQSNPASALLAENTVAAAYASSNTRIQNAFYALPDFPGWTAT